MGGILSLEDYASSLMMTFMSDPNLVIPPSGVTIPPLPTECMEQNHPVESLFNTLTNIHEKIGFYYAMTAEVSELLGMCLTDLENGF